MPKKSSHINFKAAAILLVIIAIQLTALLFVSFHGMLAYGKAYAIPVFMVDILSEAPKTKVPKKNREIISICRNKGRSISPDYWNHVCTHFTSGILDTQYWLEVEDTRKINVVIGEDQSLDSLIEAKADITKGIQYAITDLGIGKQIPDLQDALPGDFIQYWNKLPDGYHGHSAIIHSVNPKSETITIHSSHPQTSGYGRQVVFYPEIYYIARLHPNLKE